MMNERTHILSYLQKYVAQPALLELDEVPATDLHALPGWWRDILARPPAERAAAALDVWKRHTSELEDVIAYLSTSLNGVQLLRRNGSYALLYEVRSTKGTALYYEGAVPGTGGLKPAVAALWAKMPQSLQSFYSEVHGGWYYLASGSMGLLPVDQIFRLSDEDWGIMEGVQSPPLKLSATVAIFASGSGGYVVIELQDRGLAAHVWWASKTPRLNVEFWPTLDSWIAMGFET